MLLLMPGIKKQPVLDVTNYAGEWLGLDPKTHEIVSHDPDFKKAYDAAKRKGIERPLMHGVPESDGIFIGGGTLLRA